MKRIYLLIAFLATFAISSTAQRSSKGKRKSAKVQAVTQAEMQKIYEAARTPYKYGMVMAPKDNYHKFDCPTVFQKDGKWFMTYVCYNGKSGTDGRGYETWLAKSDDLLHWQTLGRVLEYGTGNEWDKDSKCCKKGKDAKCCKK